MAEHTIQKINTRIVNKHDLEVNWLKAKNFRPEKGELIVYDIEVDENGNTLTAVVDGKTVPALPNGRTTPYAYERFKLGDGIHYVNELSFAVDKVVKDWNQNDESAPDYIKNRTHYATGYSATFSNVEFEEFIDETWYEHQYYEYVFTENIFENIKASSKQVNISILGTYREEFEGVLEYDTESNVFIDNSAHLRVSEGGIDEFGTITLDSSNRLKLIGFGILSGGWNNIATKLELHTPSVLKQLDEQFIPDTIARTTDLEVVAEKIDNLNFSTLEDSTYDEESKWNDITTILNQHLYGDTIEVFPAEGCPDSTDKKLGAGYKVCSCCGHKKVIQINPQHEFDYSTVDEYTHQKYCIKCDTLITEPHLNPYWQYAITDDYAAAHMNCDICGYYFFNHDHLFDPDTGVYFTCEYSDCPLSGKNPR